MSYATTILRALQNKPIYQGTVPAEIRDRRRAANKRARLARRGKGQAVPGLTGRQQARRYAHLAGIARRANWAARSES
jgi:hypothetical protein